MLITSELNDPHQILITGVLNDRLKLTYTYLKEGDKIRECYDDTSPFPCWFFTIFFIKRASLERVHL